MDRKSKLKIFFYAVLSALFLAVFSLKVFAEVPEPTATPTIDVQIRSAFEESENTWKQKTGIHDLENIIGKIENLKNKNYKELAPLFKFNMHWFSDKYPDQDYVLADFRTMENYRYLGYTVIDYFRFLVAGFLYFETGWYLWHRLHGREVGADAE